MDKITSTGSQSVSTLKAALEAPGRQGRLVRMLEQLGWRRETRLIVNGNDAGNAADAFEIETSRHESPGVISTIIKRASLAGIDVPLAKRSTRLKELGGGRWKLGRDLFEIIQPNGDVRRTWP